MKQIRKRYCAALKAQVALDAVRERQTITKITAIYHVHPTQIGHWKKQLLEGAGMVFGMVPNLAALERAAIENEDLRRKERQIIAFMLRFVLGYVSVDDLKQHFQNEVQAKELDSLYSHAMNPLRSKRIRALVVVFQLCGISRDLIAAALCLSPRTVTKQIRRYSRSGVDGLFTARNAIKKFEDQKYKETVFAILHSPPKDYGFNRTSWRIKDIHEAMARLGMLIGKNYIDRIIKNAGYRFLKAKKVLTSNDPHYREKVHHIQNILANLKNSERFFSIDEFGPFAVKQQGGRRFVGPGETPTIPQFQKSKGCLIVTAALELSRNQVTHFYSSSKNTTEMIKLLDLLLEQYRRCTKLYLSWDAAGWHASKTFLKRVDEVNSRKFRRTQMTPQVELAPLPSRAQFLNVIESVFSGMAVAVIQNSDYGSVDEAKIAIDRHFAERNAHFQENPKRAGGKIWRKELVSTSFREGQNCKNPEFR